jgi:hypothetical protein
MRITSLPLLATALLLFASSARAQVFEGPVPDDDSDFFEVPFDVPAGTAEIEIAHVPLDDADILDWGLFDPSGAFRGYGGGNAEPAIVGELAASRSYLPGPIAPGEWRVYVGKAKLLSAAPGYRVEVTLRTTPTLTPPTDRATWIEPAPLSNEARFYAGDFHVHSEDSGDADATLDEINAFALGRGLDFVVITDHNTTSQNDRLLAAQQRSGELFFIPGVEFTTYDGHATGFGTTAYVDHRIGVDGRSVDDAAAEILAQGGLFSINHPALELGDACIGCAWSHPLPPIGDVHGVEIQTGRTLLFAPAAIQFWEQALDAGHHLAAIGGSDDHRAGRDNAAIGEPTTLVFADALTLDGLRAGILASRTVVKMQGPDDPMVVLDTNPPRATNSDTVAGATVTITATVTGGVGKTFRFVRNGLGVALPETIANDTQVFTLEVVPDDSGTQRVRAEVADDDGTPRTLTSYVWLTTAPPPPDCSCSATGRGAPGLVPGGVHLGSAACLTLIFMISRRSRRS